MNFIAFDIKTGLIRCFKNTHEVCAMSSLFIKIDKDDDLVSFIKECGGVNAAISFILKKAQH